MITPETATRIVPSHKSRREKSVASENSPIFKQKMNPSKNWPKNKNEQQILYKILPLFEVISGRFAVLSRKSARW